jgi:hypothetical protein
VDATLGANGATTTLASWLLEEAALAGRDASRDEAWSLFHGAPDLTGDDAAFRALALAYLGHVPTPPDGGAYSNAPDGVTDPARGSSHSPIYPAVPVPGSPAEKTLRAIAGLRVETSFDDEPRAGAKDPVRSLHAKVTITPRK